MKFTACSTSLNILPAQLLWSCSLSLPDPVIPSGVRQQVNTFEDGHGRAQNCRLWLHVYLALEHMMDGFNLTMHVLNHMVSSMSTRLAGYAALSRFVMQRCSLTMLRRREEVKVLQPNSLITYWAMKSDISKLRLANLRFQFEVVTRCSHKVEQSCPLGQMPACPYGCPASASHYSHASVSLLATCQVLSTTDSVQQLSSESFQSVPPDPAVDLSVDHRGSIPSVQSVWVKKALYIRRKMLQALQVGTACCANRFRC